MNRFLPLLICAELAVATIAIAPPAQAGDVPTRTQIPSVCNTNAASEVWTVPNFANGKLDNIQIYDASCADTVTVYQVVACSPTRSMTNLVTTIVTSGGSGYAALSNVWIVAGDVFLFNLTGTSTNQVLLGRRIFYP